MRVLRKGCKGEDVRYLQYKIGIDADGIFGNGTEKAVKEQQGKDGLTQDGIVGPNTQKKWGLSDFVVHIFDKSQVHFAGTQFDNQRKTPYPRKTLKQWAIEENADYVFNLAFFNSKGDGVDKYGVIKGRTLTYLKAKGQDVGYGGTQERITIDTDNICAGYKLSSQASSWGKRTRNANGLLKDGRYFQVQSINLQTEKALVDYMQNNYDVEILLIQDSGGSTAFYDRKKDVLIANEGRKEGVNGRPVASVVCVNAKTPVENKPKVCPMCNGKGTI